jgi:TRAP-type uncharacterized transport system fused permease subunit
MPTASQAKHKFCRRIGECLWGCPNCPTVKGKARAFPAGPHGAKNGGRRAKLTTYGELLLEKQKLRNYYAISEKQLRIAYAKAKSGTGQTGDKLFIALFLTMLCCIVLGMGVPTTATYCIMAATCAPILTRMGVPILAAHFFVFYFGIVADITPPVALAAYAGSAIAKSNPMKTAFNASRLAIAVFIVPYVFAYSPSMLLIETNALEVIQISLTSLIGIFGVSSGLEGYLFAKMNPVIRAVFVIGGLMLIVPSLMTDLIGLGLIAAACVFQFTMGKKAVAA